MLINGSQYGFEVIKFLVIETGTYDQQWRRPYMTEISPMVQEQIVGRYKNNNGTSPTGSVMTGVAESFLIPMRQPDREIQIVGGWGQTKYRVLLEVMTTSAAGNKTRQVIMGYTENVDKSILGSLNPNMPIHINNVVTLRDFARTLGDGSSLNQVGMANASHLLATNEFSGYRGPIEYRTRPMDIFSYISQAAIAEGNPDANSNDMYDTRTVNNVIPTKSERKNGTSAAFVSKVLGAMKQADITAQSDGSSGFDSMMEAQNLVSEYEAASDFFLQALKAHRRAPSIANYFTIGELESISANTKRVMHVVPVTADMAKRRYRAGENVDSDWGKTNDYVTTATILGNQLPGILMDCMLTQAIVSASNRTRLDGTITVQISKHASFADMNMAQYIMSAESRILTEIMLPLTRNNQRDVNIDMMVDLTGESRFTISLDGAPSREYVVPSFADALLAPVLTNNAQNAFDMAGDFRSLGDLITDAGTQAAPMKSAVFQAGNGGSLSGSVLF